MALKVHEEKSKPVVMVDPLDLEQEMDSRYTLSGLLTFGNKKLPKTTAIFNMCSGTDCPSKKLGMCPIINQGKRCYAIKAEQVYPQALPYRRRQERFWDSVTAEQFAAQFLANVSRKKIKIKQLRVSEAGDFRSQADVTKMDKVAGILKGAGIRTYVYSARRDLDFSKVKHMTVNGSGFLATNEFRAVAEIPEKLQEGQRLCAGDCRICNLCSMARGKTMLVKYH